MIEPMTQQRLDEIRARCEAATPGPWTLTGSKHQLVDSDHKAPMHKSIVCEVWNDLPNNAAFIVHARQDIPDLLQEVERLRSKVISAVETMITVQDYIDSAECRDDLNGINEYIDEWIGRKEG